MPKYRVELYESVYITRKVEAADEQEAQKIVENGELPSVAEAWAKGEVETDVHGWEVYEVDEVLADAA